MRNDSRYQNQQNTSQHGEQREPLKMDITPKEFDGLLKSKITTSVDLSKQVNGIFRPVFADYEGSVILPNNQGLLELYLYFKDKPVSGDKIKALQPAVGRTSRNVSNVFDRISSLNMRYKNKTYSLTQDAKDILSEFIHIRKNQKINWNQFVFEQSQQEYNMYTIYIKVVGLDLNRIIKKIYGGKDSERNRVDYNIGLIRPIGMVATGMQQNYLINIQQLNTKAVEDMVKLVGMVPTTGTLPIVR